VELAELQEKSQRGRLRDLPILYKDAEKGGLIPSRRRGFRITCVIKAISLCLASVTEVRFLSL